MCVNQFYITYRHHEILYLYQARLYGQLKFFIFLIFSIFYFLLLRTTPKFATDNGEDITAKKKPKEEEKRKKGERVLVTLIAKVTPVSSVKRIRE